MARMSADMNDKWLEDAEEIAAVFASVPMDFSGSSEAWGYGGGRELDDLVAKAREITGQPTDWVVEKGAL